ncbi:hypothetical protein Hamer_G031223, partial [Homarus americanus]
MANVGSEEGLFWSHRVLLSLQNHGERRVGGEGNLIISTLLPQCCLRSTFPLMPPFHLPTGASTPPPHWCLHSTSPLVPPLHLPTGASTPPPCFSPLALLPSSIRARRSLLLFFYNSSCPSQVPSLPSSFPPFLLPSPPLPYPPTHFSIYPPFPPSTPSINRCSSFTPPLLHQWTKANALFKPPVINQCRTIELKLTKLWHKAVETSLGKGNLARKNEFLHTLVTLFDILTCKCSIQLCSESNCSHSGKRENNSHIDCGCPREKKIPAQRTKAEGQGSMQMGSIDYSETKKQIANAKKREQIREREQKKKMKREEAIQREEELCQDVYHFFDSSSDEQEATSDDIPPINVNATKLSELVDLSLEVLEPPLTTSLTSQELRNLKETPMQVPKWPSHTQSVERCVKMVTEAAGYVYSHERR